MNRKQSGVICRIFCISSLSQTGNKKRRLLPDEFGHLVLNNYSEKFDQALVVFEQWIHCSKFTCRVYHVDIGLGRRPAQPESTPLILSAVSTAAIPTVAEPLSNVRKSLSAVRACRLTRIKSTAIAATCQARKCRVTSISFHFAHLPKERIGNGIHSRTQDAMSFSEEHPTNLVQRYVALQRQIEKLDETPRRFT